MKFPDSAAQAGQIVADVYRLEEPLGRGAMGRIWRGVHLRLKSKVAIKFLDPAISDDPETFNRFVREAQSAAAVHSAHVVQIFDCGVDDGTPYISMELLEGESLDKRLSTRAVLTAVELDKVFNEVARAIDTAHAAGVVHRDLKPGNIFLVRERDFEITKVLDFGVAKLMNPSIDADSAAGTRTGTMLGTPYYMSPEQVRGSRGLDQRTDLWSLAIIAYECLTGELPFRGDSIGDICVQICTGKATLPSELVDVPAGFDEWFSKATRKNPDERFASARQMAELLSRILALAPTPTARAPSTRERARHEAATLPSVPPAFGAEPPAPRSVLHASAEVPPSPSTHPMTTLIAPPRQGSSAHDSSHAHNGWRWAVAVASLFGVIMLWLLLSPRPPSVFADGNVAPATPPSVLADGNVAPARLRSEVPSEPAVVTGEAPRAKDLGVDARPSIDAPAVADGIDRVAPESASAATLSRSMSSASQKPRLTRTTKARPARKARKRARTPLNAAPPESDTAEPSSIPQSHPEADPFAERQ